MTQLCFSVAELGIGIELKTRIFERSILYIYCVSRYLSKLFFIQKKNDTI